MEAALPPRYAWSPPPQLPLHSPHRLLSSARGGRSVLHQGHTHHWINKQALVIARRSGGLALANFHKYTA